MQKQWKQEEKRLQRFIKAAEKRGFIFPENVIPKEPKRVTKKSVERLQNITPTKLYSKAKYKDETGKLISGTEGRTSERKKAASKAHSMSNKSLNPLSGKAETSIAGGRQPRKDKEDKSKKKTKKRKSKTKQQTKQKGKKPTNRKKPTNKEKSKRQEPIFEPERQRVMKEKGITETEANRMVQQRKQEAKRGKQGYTRDKLPQIADNVLSNVEEAISSWSPSPNWADYYGDIKRRDKNLLERMLNAQIAKEGRRAVAERFEKHATEMKRLTNDILYGSGGKDGRDTQRDFAEFAQILYGRSITHEESIELAEAQEYSEDNEVI